MDKALKKILTPQEAVALQRKLAQEVDVKTPLGAVRFVAGTDVSFNLGSNTVYSVVVVWDRIEHKIVDKSGVVATADFPYIPGLLSFREVPSLITAFRKLSIKPDVTIVDGHGYAHPRRIGIASHLGILLQIPTIGCGKSLLCGHYEIPNEDRGSRSPLMHRNERIGYALRTRKKVAPVYVSPGHLCTFDEACDLVLELAPKYRFPETTRQAHRYANELRLLAANDLQKS